jgi:hypothetical protein
MLSFVVKQVEPGQAKVNCQQVMMNKCICLLKNPKKNQMLLIIGLFFWPTNLPLKNVGISFSANKTFKFTYMYA